MSQILRRYLTKEGSVRKFFLLFNMDKKPCIIKLEGLARSKLPGISQTNVKDNLIWRALIFIYSICPNNHTFTLLNVTKKESLCA